MKQQMKNKKSKKEREGLKIIHFFGIIVFLIIMFGISGISLPSVFGDNESSNESECTIPFITQSGPSGTQITQSINLMVQTIRFIKVYSEMDYGLIL